MHCNKLRLLLIFLCFSIQMAHAQNKENFEIMDVFDLKYVSSPQISPDGSRVAYLVNYKDIMTDKSHSNLWLINGDGSRKQQLTEGKHNDSGPQWSNNGKWLAFKSNKDEKSKIYIYSIEKGAIVDEFDTKGSPGTLAWSPDDQYLAFDQFVPKPQESFYSMPEKPEGAEWNTPPTLIDRLPYRVDGIGYLKSGYKQFFTLTIKDGIVKQVTDSDFEHSAPVWGKGGKMLYGSGLINPAGPDEPFNSEVYEVDIASGKTTSLTTRFGQDANPKVSKDGNTIAYLGFDDIKQAFHSSFLYQMDLRTGVNKKVALPENFDRSIMDFNWAGNGNGFYILYEDLGMLQLSFLNKKGEITPITNNISGISLARPYTSGQYSASQNGKFAFTYGNTQMPAELAISDGKVEAILTKENEALLSKKALGSVEEYWYTSSYDQQKIQGWIVKPPNFNPDKQYPLILHIHGGPHAAFGPHFSIDVQAFAAAGYVVLYTNPRGSTSYGQEFINGIMHSFPGNDYHDLMSGVAGIIRKGYIDGSNLFVHGPSGGGLLSAWLICNSNEFRAAAVVKPVINWYSFALYSDLPQRFAYWFPEAPWENPQHYLDRSPISKVGNVKTPTLLITGETDHRTPIAETEQFYAALKMNKVETAMLRVPGAFHAIDAKGSGTVARLSAILAWFDKYGDQTPLDFEYAERDLLPGNTMEEKLQHVSQIDKLESTQGDYARCSASACLNAYLLMGGEWSDLNEKYNLNDQLTFSNVHHLQDTLIMLADKDNVPGIFGSFKPEWDDKGALKGWYMPEEVELPYILEALNFDYEPLIGPSKERAFYKKERVEKFFRENPNGVLLMGVNEDMENWRARPVEENRMGNHYIICYKRGEDYHFLDTWRRPGRFSGGVFSKEEVESMLFETRNMLLGMVLKE